VTKIHFTAYGACVLKISNKACRTGYPYPDPVPAEKHVLDIHIRLKTYYPAGYPSGKPDSDHLWQVYIKNLVVFLVIIVSILCRIF